MYCTVNCIVYRVQQQLRHRHLYLRILYLDMIPVAHEVRNLVAIISCDRVIEYQSHIVVVVRRFRLDSRHLISMHLHIGEYFAGIDQHFDLVMINANYSAHRATVPLWLVISSDAQAYDCVFDVRFHCGTSSVHCCSVTNICPAFGIEIVPAMKVVVAVMVIETSTLAKERVYLDVVVRSQHLLTAANALLSATPWSNFLN